MANRKLLLAGIVGFAILCGVLGWVAGQQVRNPDEIRAETAPPPRSRITVPVEARALSNDVITRVNAKFSDSASLSIATDATSAVGAIVTGRVPEKGALLVEGSVLLEVSERPFFILEGELPAFRSISPGDDGSDVLQLEEALKRLGHFAGTPDSDFDEETELAISALYEAEGYEAPGPSLEDKERLVQAGRAVSDAEEEVQAARDALQDSVKAPPESVRLQAIQQRERIEQNLRDAEDAAANWQDLDPEIAAAKAGEKQANKVYEEAIARSNTALTNVHPDTGEIPTVDEMREFREIANQATIALNDARAELNEAISTSTANADAQKALADAREQYAIDLAAYNESQAPFDTSALQKSLDAALERQDDAIETRDEFEAEIGIWMPDHEFMFLKNLPRRVNRVLVERGSFVTSSVSVADVTGAELRIEGGLTEDRRDLVNEGDLILIDSAELGLEIQGRINRLDDVAGANPEFESRFYFTVEIEDMANVDIEQLVGVGNFRALIPLERTEGEVLTVPVSALVSGPDGIARVEVERDPSQPTEYVQVIVGLVPKGGGYVEVSPIEGSLAVGDQVVIGSEIAAQSGSTAGAGTTDSGG